MHPWRNGPPHEAHEWKADLIEQEFLPHEAQIIKGISLSIQEIPYKQVWLPLTRGEYSTRTAYQLLVRTKRSKRSNCFSRGSTSQLWKSIWSLQVPYKVKHLIWRAANEAIPTLHNFLRRNVVQTAYCPNCKFGCEDIVHALCSCQWLFVLWEADGELKKCTRYR